MPHLCCGGGEPDAGKRRRPGTTLKGESSTHRSPLERMFYGPVTPLNTTITVHRKDYKSGASFSYS